MTGGFAGEVIGDERVNGATAREVREFNAKISRTEKTAR
jgi:hypothetical protein